MEEQLALLMQGLPWLLLLGIIVVTLLGLAKGADWLVDEAVTLSARSGVPKVVIGATVVSLGTTTPETVVSVFAALQGKPGLALGNAVGSIICDTGFILGLACLIRPLPLQRSVINRQGWIQVAVCVLLVAAAFPWGQPGSAWTSGGQLSQLWGWIFLVLLGCYLVLSVFWSKGGGPSEGPLDRERGVPVWKVLLKLAGAIAVVVGSSHILIPAVSEAAIRLEVPDSIIAATLVAFGTSLPELVTAVTAARQGHGELAVGNVIGADILNVLFVSGMAAAVTAGGLEAPPVFFTLYFPSMLFVIAVFRVGVLASGDSLRRPFGLILLASYVLVTTLSYAVG